MSPTSAAQIAAQCRAQPLVYDGVLPEICPALARVILARMQGSRGRSAGSINVGGWKSGEDFFQWPDQPVQALRQAIVGMIGDARPLVGWAMVNRAGSRHPRHQHPIAVLTGIYYVAAGSSDAITPTVFECEGGALEVDPHPGRIAIFPGSMWHSLPAYPGDQPRITVAFDARR